MKNFLQKRVNRQKLFYLLFLGTVFTVFIILAFLNVQIKNQIAEINLLESPMSFSPAKYPEVSNIYDPEISALGAVVIDKISQVSLYEKNSTLRFPPASTTKIMTALVALDYYQPDDVLSIKNATVEGSMMGFSTNEKFKFSDLLYAMLLPSANEAAQAIADNYPGGNLAFVVKMNEKAKELHLTNTYYADPIGINDIVDHTTPLDLARLSSIALNNEIFSKVVSTKSRSINSLSGNRYELFNLNRLLEIPGVNGVKTGHTEGAGDVLVTSRRLENGQDLIFVVMQSQDRFADTEILINYLNDNINYLSIRP